MLLRSYLIRTPKLTKGINLHTMAIISCMDHSISIYLTKPHIITLSIGIKDIHSDIRITHLSDDCAISTISNINSTILGGCVTSEWLGSLESMNMILENSCNFVFIEIGHPVEQSVEVP